MSIKKICMNKYKILLICCLAICLCSYSQNTNVINFRVDGGIVTVYRNNLLLYSGNWRNTSIVVSWYNNDSTRLSFDIKRSDGTNITEVGYLLSNIRINNTTPSGYTNFLQVLGALTASIINLGLLNYWV